MATEIIVDFKCTRNCSCAGKSFSAGKKYKVTAKQAEALSFAGRGFILRGKDTEKAIPMKPVEKT